MPELDIPGAFARGMSAFQRILGATAPVCATVGAAVGLVHWVALRASGDSATGSVMTHAERTTDALLAGVSALLLTGGAFILATALSGRARASIKGSSVPLMRSGRERTVLDDVRSTLPAALPTATIVAGTITALVFIPSFVGSFAGLLGVLLWLAAFVSLGFLGTHWVFAGQVAALETSTGSAALARSASLVADQFIRGLVFLLALAVVITVGAVMIFALASGIFPPVLAWPIGMAVVTAVSIPFAACVTTAAYLQLAGARQTFPTR